MWEHNSELSALCENEIVVLAAQMEGLPFYCTHSNLIFIRLHFKCKRKSLRFNLCKLFIAETDM